MADDVTVATVNHRRRGKQLFDKGVETLNRRDKLTAFMKLDDAVALFYRSALAYKAAGKWREAGDSLVKCAQTQMDQKLSLEASVLYTDAAESYLKVDKGEALRSYRSAISIYCELGRFDIAGRLERKVAEMHFQSKHWADASYHFRKAGNFLSGENLLDQSDSCFEKSAYCLVEMGEFEEAGKEYELIATGCTQSNLRRFNAVDFLFRAALCLIGIPYTLKQPEPHKHDTPGFVEHEEPMLKVIQEATDLKYSRIKAAIQEYQNIDYMWTFSKEKLFLQNIIKTRLEWDRHGFADHLYYWHTVRPLDRTCLLMLLTVKKEFDLEWERREDRRVRLEAEKTRRLRRKQKYDELKKAMRELGVYGAVVVEEDDEDRRLTSIITGGKFVKHTAKHEKFEEEEEEKKAEEAAAEGGEGGAEGEKKEATFEPEDEEIDEALLAEDDEEQQLQPEKKERKRRVKKKK